LRFAKGLREHRGEEGRMSMETTKLHVGNIAYETTREKLEAAFSEAGQVQSVTMGLSKRNGDPRGFAFVQMATAEQARSAIDSLNDREIDGRRIRVAEATGRIRKK
jgi:RNA recognition motif-containing protein